MNSIFSLLFLAIQARINTITTGSPATPVFPTNDAEYGQLEAHSGDNRPPVSWPCALTDIDNAVFAEIGGNSENGVATVIIRLGFPPYSSSSSITPPEFRNKALYHYELEDQVHKNLHGWSPSTVDIDNTHQADLSDIFGHMIRVSARTEDRTDMIRVRVLTYTIGLEDYSTKPVITQTPATPVITATFHP